MGGHGCLVLSSQYPDVASASLCTAGWTKMAQYVPAHANSATSFADAWLLGLLRAATAEYDSDVHAGNLAGVPAKVRMGGNDDNVSPWHLRRFARLVAQHARNASQGAPASQQQQQWEGGCCGDCTLRPPGSVQPPALLSLA